MRKFVKKIATVVASLAMVSAMGLTALAVEPYSFVGNPNLFGDTNADNADVGWVPTSEDQLFTAVDGMTGVYSFKSTYVTAADDASVDDAKRAERRQFKILAEGPDMGWSYQMSFGNPDAVWADNMTQFQIEGIKDGEFTVYLNPTTGYVCVIQDAKALDLLVRFHSRDEDPSNYVELKKDAILAEGYAATDTGMDDAAYAKFVDECVVAEGGTASNGGDDVDSTDDTKEDDSKGEGTSDEVTSDDSKDETKPADTTKADDKEDDDEGISPVVIVVIVVVVVVVIGVIVAATKKKKK